jgi:hypothetical protein
MPSVSKCLTRAADLVLGPVFARMFEWFATGEYSLKTLAQRAYQEDFRFRKSGQRRPRWPRAMFAKFRLLEHLRGAGSRPDKPCIIRAIAAGSAQVLLERLRRERSLESRGRSSHRPACPETAGGGRRRPRTVPGVEPGEILAAEQQEKSILRAAISGFMSHGTKHLKLHTNSWTAG